MTQSGVGEEYTHLRPKRIHDLVSVLNENCVDLGQSYAPRGISAKVQSLWDLMESRSAALVLKPQDSHASSSSGEDGADGDVFLLNQRAYLHWQLGHRIEHTLVNTHSRDKSTSKRAPPLPLCERLVDEAYEDMVANFMSRFLDIDLAETTGHVTIRRVDYETDYVKESENFPGLSTIFALYSVYFTLDMKLPLNFGRPIVRSQKASTEGVEELWRWRPDPLCPSQVSHRTDLSTLEMHPKYDHIINLLEKAFQLDEASKAVLCVLKSSFDGTGPVLLLVAVFRPAVVTTEILMVQVMWNTSDDEVFEQSRAGSELMKELSNSQRCVPGVDGLALQIGGTANYFWDTNRKMALQAFALPGSCLELPELSQATLSRSIQPPVVLLSELLSATFGRGVRTPLLNQLVSRFEGVLGRLVGPGSVLSRLMAGAFRSSVDLLESYSLDTLASIANPTYPLHNSHSVFHENMGGLIDKICKLCGLDPPQEALREKLQEVQQLCIKISSKYWRKEAWKPLCHLAHGNFSPSSIAVDAFGSTWLFNWGTPLHQLSWQRGKAKCGGVQPLFRDLARLSIRLLLEGGLPLPMSLSQAQAICTAQWVDLPDISRWLDVPQSVAYLFQRMMFDTEFQKSDQRATRAQASRRVSKLLESTSMLGSYGMDHSQGRLVGREEDARRAFQNAEALADEVMRLPLLKLHAPPKSASEIPAEEDKPPQPSGTFAELMTEGEDAKHAIVRELALNHQKILHRFAEESQRLCYERYLHDPSWLVDLNQPEGERQGPQQQLQPVDLSPLLFGLPLLEELLDLLVAPGLDPWQKAFGCSFAAELCARLLPLLGALGGRAVEMSGTQEDSDEENFLGVDVRYAEGHRLAGEAEGFGFGRGGRSDDGTLGYRSSLTPEVLEKVLIGWPCPTAGVREAMLDGHRMNAGKLPREDFQKDLEILQALRESRRANLWRKSAAGFYELEGVQVRQEMQVAKKKSITRNMTLSSRQVTQRLTRKSLTKERAASIKTLEVVSLKEDAQELQWLGRRIGLSSYLSSLVEKCPVGATHGTATHGSFLEAYRCFPCSLCNEPITSAETSAHNFAYCLDCWGRQRRFTICHDCLKEHVTTCDTGSPKPHRMQLLDVSPYAGIPQCHRCARRLVWPWEMHIGQGESPSEPQWFHCSTCGKSHDLCFSCAERSCPQQHPMSFLSTLRGGYTCKSCGKGGNVQLYHCCICQEARSEVVYPNGEAALADLKLTMSMNEVKVSSVVPNGPASLAGVQVGQRLTVNDEALLSPQALEEMQDTILVEFNSSSSFDANFESAKAVRENLAFQVQEGRIFVTEVRKFYARSAGIDLGCQLLTVNGEKALALVDGTDLNLDSLNAPFVLRLRQSGPKLLCHPGCSVLCGTGHEMKAQHCGGILCPRGHTLKCMSFAELKCPDSLCESCGQSTDLVLACANCLDTEAMKPTSDCFNLLCFSCGWQRAVKRCSPSPYPNQGQVYCCDCGRNVLEADGSESGSLDEHVFHHCSSCWEGGVKQDRCYFCSIRRLSCPKSHHLLPCLASPFSDDLSCAGCGEELFPHEIGYHCDDCWWQGRRTDRCQSCGELCQLKYSIDQSARLQVITGDAPKEDVSWRMAYQPVGHTLHCCSDGTEIELDIAMKLRGLVYPLGARMSLPCGEATVISLHESGKYVLRLDGTRKQLLFEPDLANHVPSGVWRYSPGQLLMVFVDGKWRDLRVHKVSNYGNHHILEELGQQIRWDIDLNSLNHSPAWLSSDEWWVELRRWEDALLCGLNATDVFTGQPVDILTLTWSLVDGQAISITETIGEGIFSDLPTEADPSLWTRLLAHLAQRAPGRQHGVTNNAAASHGAPVLLLGPVASGKTRLLRRLAVEAMLSHDGEVVPLLVTAMQLLMGTSISPRASNEFFHQRRVTRRSAKDSQDIALRRLQSTDFLVIFLRMAFGAQTTTTRFLRQALHSRRLLLLVDALELIPIKMQVELLKGLQRLCRIGVRVVVAGSPPPDVFAFFPPKEETQADVPEQKEQKEQKPKFAMFAGLDGGSAEATSEQRPFTKRVPPSQEREESDCWWKPRQEFCQFWLVPPREMQRQRRANLRLGTLTGTPLEVIEEAQEARLFDSFLSVQSAPFLELFLSHAEMEILHPTAEKLDELGGSSRPSPRSSHAESIFSEVPQRLSLPSLVDPKEKEKKETTEEVEPLLRGACGILNDLFAASCAQIISSLQEVKMSRGGRLPQKVEPGHLQLALQLLALKATENGSDRLEEEEANYVIEFGGSSQLMTAWRQIQQEMQNENFWLLRRCESWISWEELVVHYVFPCRCVQSFLASLELAQTWNKQFFLGTIEDAFEDPAAHPLLPFLAELLPGPLTLRFAGITEDKARLMLEFFCRCPMVSYLSLSGSAIGLQRNTLRLVADALKVDQHLQHLDLSENCLGSEGAHIISQALAEHPTLEELVLARNHIGQVGGVKIVDLLRVNHNITRVDMDDNPIGADWAHYIYVLQRDRSATLASAKKTPMASGESGARMSSLKLDALQNEMKELKPAVPLSKRLRRKEEDMRPSGVLSARTPRLLR